MFAVVKTGGKQYRVAVNDRLTVENLPAEPDSTIELTEVLMVGGDGAPKVGAPIVNGAKVTAKVIAHELADKVLIFKKKRRHNYRRKRGHRQSQTVLQVTAIHPGK